MKKIKPFFKKAFNLIVSLLLAALDLIIYIFAVIALYQDDYLAALLLMLFGISMEIRKGLKLIAETNKANTAKEVINIVHKAAFELSEEMKIKKPGSQ